MSILKLLAALLLVVYSLPAVPAAAAPFLQFPLQCSTTLISGACPAGSINYTIRGAYTANSMNSILDHSMKLNSTGYYPYGKLSNSGGNGVIRAFNGEVVSGPANPSDETCIGGTIFIHPDWDPSQRLTNAFGCASGYASYDEHPGYDYKAALGTPVYAAATGTVISTTCYLGNVGSGSCASWGALAIRPTTGAAHDYFYQYLHMDTIISVVPGQTITAGQYIGTVGGRCGTGCSLGAHLHFEVRYIPTAIGPEAYPIVDPYGWVGSGTDPLYSSSVVAPTNLWL